MINICFLISLYAGITSLYEIISLFYIGFKYSHLIINKLKVIVTKLNLWSQSAGNFYWFSVGRTSETLRDKSDIKKISIHVPKQKISIHVPKHIRPKNNTELGHYLAGLIDGDGHFSKSLQLVIAFHESDASLAYYLKKEIGFGNVYKVKSKNGIIFVIDKLSGLLKILELIHNKIRSKKK